MCIFVPFNKYTNGLKNYGDRSPERESESKTDIGKKEERDVGVCVCESGFRP